MNHINEPTTVNWHGMHVPANMMGLLRYEVQPGGGTHAYRLRVVNASNSRTYKLGWSDGRPLAVIATGGDLLERPLTKPYVMLTSGQHSELWEDFSSLGPLVLGARLSAYRFMAPWG